MAGILLPPPKRIWMSEQPDAERRSMWRVGPESTWTTVLPVAFIIASLVSLVATPIVVSNHTKRVRTEIQRVAEPARRAANQMQVDLSAELDKVIAFQVTGQPQYRKEYLDLVQEQEANARVLRQLTPILGDEANASLHTVMEETGRWHEGVRSGEFLDRQLPEGVFLARLFERHPAYEHALRSTSEVELLIQTGIEDRLQRIRSAERTNISLTIVLTFLALTSALLVAGLGRQMRLLAAEAMRRRREAEKEAADAGAARTFAERQERRAAFLAGASQALTASLDYEETVATLGRLIVPNLADLCVIDMVDDTAGLRRVAAVHRSPGDQAALTPMLGERIAEVPEIVTRAMSERSGRLVGPSAALMRHLGWPADDARSTIIVPLISRGQTLGVITAAAPRGKNFTEEDLSLCVDLARHGSFAIDNAHLYHDAQQAVRAREQVLAIVSHDLRNPLNTVTLASQLLQTSNASDDERKQIDMIVLSAKRMSRLIADLLDIT